MGSTHIGGEIRYAIPIELTEKVVRGGQSDDNLPAVRRSIQAWKGMVERDHDNIAFDISVELLETFSDSFGLTPSWLQKTSDKFSAASSSFCHCTVPSGILSAKTAVRTLLG